MKKSKKNRKNAVFIGFFVFEGRNSVSFDLSFLKSTIKGNISKNMPIFPLSYIVYF